MTKISLTRSAGRAGIAAGAAALLAFGLAAPASADPVRAQYTGNAETGTTIKMNGQNTGTNLFRLQLEDGTELTAYCIDLETGIRSSAWYHENEWANYPGEGEFTEPAKVHWILQNSYPEKTAAELAEAAGVENRRFGDEQALAATQAAIWHFSNGAELSGERPDGVREVYDYLIGAAEDLPQTAEPDASLSITPESASGEAGGVIGEFEISTSASEVPVVLGDDVPEGVELVDLETGEPVAAVNDGDTVGFNVPEDAEEGTASFSLSTTAMVQTGRLFLGEDPDKATQTLITAEGGEATVSASAGVDWTAAGEEPPATDGPSDEPSDTPSPTDGPSDEPSETPAPTDEPSDKPSAPADDNNSPSLPVTGGALAGLVAAGVAALGAGGGAIYLSRRRKAADTTDVEG
ncbi:TQXA domain-containing protein [Nocardiopsis sp. Huas11]|uniref:Cys-Gln thioester bond-forming surface protein n=1 Tax=Nocardiopsis sp. Huas11 TaxID=2183912 RepID=UPI000EAB61EC|nr:Cys-Gln thioester bond-forming surface protein [Nocardiopsis sp. Huas11]RKS10761.1 TQXA domain-containing protein [Nocardiopsis sp. Huas11]